MARIYSLIVLAGLFGSAYAHDWFHGLRDPQSGFHCCNLATDCALTQVNELHTTYYIPLTKELFPKWRVIWKSPDGHWYRCHFRDTQGPLVGKTKCLIGPPPNS